MVAECKKLAECLYNTSTLVVKDPRCPSNDNDRFLNMLEKYYEQGTEACLEDARPDLHYQVGVTPEGVEFPKCARDPKCVAEIANQSEENKAHMPEKPDPKWRYMWKIGERPKDSKFQELNAPPVVPKAIPEWSEVMDLWGGKMLNALEVVAEMLAVGYGLPVGTFRDMMQQAPHLLAPTGSDLNKYQDDGTIFAGYHYDLNFLTIHGKSRYPGLFIWLRDGTKVSVKVPEGCLLVQAGKQIEWMTGGHVRAGMHEVVFNRRTGEAVAKAKADGKSLWRISSTVFGHLASDRWLEPVGHFATEAAKAEYPGMYVGDFVSKELESIALKSSDDLED